MKRPGLRCASGSRLCAVVLVAGLLGGLAWAGPQEGGERDRSDEAYASLIERLEQGMSALKELGRTDALEQLGKIADQVRAERRRAREEREAAASGPARDPAKEGERNEGDLGQLEVRLEILRLARDAWLEVGRKDAAEVLTNAVRLGEMQQKGMGPADPAFREAAEHVSMEGVIEVLRGASRLYADTGSERRAAQSMALAELYQHRMSEEGEEEGEEHEGSEEQEGRENEDEEGENEHEGREGREHAHHVPAEGGTEAPPDHALDDLGTRLEILGLALHAHAEAKHPDAVELLGRMIRLGRLEQQGADGGTLAHESRSIPMGRVVETLRRAALLWNEKGNARAAQFCRQLADFYDHRERVREREEGAVHAPREASPEPNGHDTSPRAPGGSPGADAALLKKLAQRMDRIEAALRELREEIERMKKDSR